MVQLTCERPAQRDQMATLGLVPSDMTSTSLLNVFPRQSSLIRLPAFCLTYALLRTVLTHRFFEGHYMTFYPCLDTIRHCIELEEERLKIRERDTNTGNADPGRLSYSSTYATLPRTTLYDVFFDVEYGQDTILDYRNRSLHATYRTSSNQSLSFVPPVTLATSPAIMIWMRTSVLAGIQPQTPRIEVILISLNSLRTCD